MISVEQALQQILEQQSNWGEETVPLLSSVHRILAQPIVSDTDFPAFHRVTMDGIAINTLAFEAGKRRFAIEQLQAAGQPQSRLQQADGCIEIMTGAVLPEGTDAVIPYEACEIRDGIATVSTTSVPSFQNIHRQGADHRSGDLLLAPGTRITPAIIGILATAGMAMVPVQKLPRVAVCSTGDELVPIHEQPAPHQIRRSNVYTLAAALLQQGIAATLHHLPDEPAIMKQQLEPLLLQHDALLFSGAVSMGKKDFLPQVLQELGMQTIFHKVAQKPGKPLLFGRFGPSPVVFGFPGNPTSTLVCFHLFFRQWLTACLGTRQPQQRARLATDVTFRPALRFHLPVTIRNENGLLLADPGFGTNSGDAVSLARADGIISLPADQTDFRQGDDFEAVLFAP